MRYSDGPVLRRADIPAPRSRTIPKLFVRMHFLVLLTGDSISQPHTNLCQSLCIPSGGQTINVWVDGLNAGDSNRSCFLVRVV
jgi:hypothetical protein